MADRVALRGFERLTLRRQQASGSVWLAAIGSTLSGTLKRACLRCVRSLDQLREAAGLDVGGLNWRHIEYEPRLQ